MDKGELVNALEISDYILLKINPDGMVQGKGNLMAYNILIHITYEMLIQSKSIEDIKLRIDVLTSDPVVMYKTK